MAIIVLYFVILLEVIVLWLPLIFSLLVYFALTFYVAYNGWIWLRKTYHFRYKNIYFLTVFLISISFFISQALHSNLLRWVGFIWLIIFACSLLLFPVLNLIYFINKKRGLKWLGFLSILLYVIVLIFGSYNMWNPVIVKYDVEIESETELADLKIMLVSDIHISETIGPKFTKRLVGLAREIEPDVIFLAGDVIDNSIDPYLEFKLSEILRDLNAPMGVYTVLGNHEYYGGDIPIFIEEMTAINIDVLVDEVINFNDLFYIVGRKDFSDKERLPIDQLTNNLDKNKPIFLIDHQPREFDEVSAAGVDLMVSGHTHKGQIFPGNLITKSIYENHFGYLQKDNLHTVVSSGYGIWGPPFRIGSRSEVVELNVHFKK